MFSLLSDKLDDTFRKLRGLNKISESNIADAMREIRMALLDADVEYSVAREFIAHVKEQAMGEAVLKTVKPGEQIVKIFRDQLAELLGGEAADLNLTCQQVEVRLESDDSKDTFGRIQQIKILVLNGEKEGELRSRIGEYYGVEEGNIDIRLQTE